MTDEPRRDQRDLREGSDRPIVIPDGGLGSALPVWMQETPTWKNEPSVTTIRALPPPESTPIDLATILTLSDLPSWLQAIAARQAQESGSGPEPESAMVDVPEPETLNVTSPQNPSPRATPSTTVNQPPGVPAPQHPWWASDTVMGALMTAVVLVIIFVLLRATNVL